MSEEKVNVLLTIYNTA